MKKILLLLSAVFLFQENNAQVLNTSFCQTNGTVMAVAVDSVNNVVYIGGAFTQVCGQPRKNLAAMNLTTGALTTFTANPNANVFSLCYYKNALYVGGSFSMVNGVGHNYAAKFNTLSKTLTSWAPAITTGSSVNAIVASGDKVFLGGNFLLTIATGKNICELDTGTAAATSLPDYPDNQVNALSVDGDHLYVGGSFANVGTTIRGNLAKYYISTGELSSTWDPEPDAPVYALCATAGRVFVGGSFSFIGSGTSSRSNIAEVDSSDASATSWDPGANSSVLAMGYRYGYLYVAGNYTAIGGRSKNYLGAVDVISGLTTNWDAQVSTAPQQLGLSPGNISFGGSFATVLGQTRASFAVVCINPIDTISVAPDGPTDVCAGLSGVSYSVSPVSGATSYVWTYSGTGATINGTSNTVTVDFSSTATSGTLSVKATNGCESSNTIDIGINTYSFTINMGSGSSMTCGDSTNIYSSDNYQGSGTITYAWLPVAGLDVTNQYQVKTGTRITRTYTLTETSTEGCVAKDTITVTVNPFPLNTSYYLSSVKCSVADTLHVTNAYPGTDAVTYTWSPAASLSSSHSADPVATPTVSTDYTVTASSAVGCAATPAIVSISVDQLNYNATSLYSNITCGDSTQLGETDDYPGTGAVTYTWSPSTGLSNTHLVNPSAKPITTTTYTLVIKTAEGCRDTTNITINVSDIAVNPGSTPGTITCGDAAQLGQTNNYGGSGTLSYTWSPSTALSATNTASPTASPISSQTYTLILASSDGCMSSGQVSLGVNALQINTAGQYSVACHSTVNLATTANTSNPNLTYSWTPSAGLSNTTSASPNAAVYSNATFNVTMSLPSSGCADANGSVSLVLTPPNTPQICMVTVDSASTHNIVYWDKSSFSNASIDSFRIYREISTGVYGIVGTVHYNALSEFHDYGANPNVTTYRYKLSALDSCGLESQLSPYHNTIYIIYVGSGQYTWNPGYTIEPATNPVNNYLLMRDDNNTGSWHQVSSTTGTQNTIADPSWASFPNANWQVETSWSISCSPTAKQSNGTQAAIIKSKSNISNNRTTSVKQTETSCSIYPNPTNGLLTLSLDGFNGKATIKVISSLGEEVYSGIPVQAGDKQTIDLSKCEGGVYFVHITTEKENFIKRIIKN